MTNSTVSTVSNANFKSKLAGVIRSAGNINENVQALCIFAIESAKAPHYNLSPATQLIVKTREVKAISSRQISKFLLAHIQNTQWKKDDGKADRLAAAKGKKIEVFDPTVTWSEFEKPKASAKLPTALTMIKPEAAAEKVAAYKAKVEVTSDRKAIDAQIEMLESQLKALNLKKQQLTMTATAGIVAA